MKRSFKELDRSIPECMWEIHPDKKDKLQLIDQLDMNIYDLWSSYKKKCFALNCQESTKQKILRIYLRHKFVAATAEEKSHFVLSIEGRIVDSKIGNQFPLGMFFSSISVQQVEKKISSDNPLCDWQQSAFPEGTRANCFRFRIYGDKACAIKVYLTRSDYALKRFEPPATLRQIFPMISMDPTEGEMLRALWKYIHYFGLVEPGHADVRLDEKLRTVFGLTQQTCPLHSLRERMREVLMPCRAICVEYALTLSSGELSGSGETADKRFTSRALARAGGRVFDLDVDIVDPFAAPLLEGVNAMTAAEAAMEQPFEQIQNRLSFLVTSMLHCAPEIEALRTLCDTPIDPLLIAPCGPSSERNSVTPLSHATAAPALLPHPLLDSLQSEGEVSGSGRPAQEKIIAPALFMETLADSTKTVTERRDRSSGDGKSHPRRCDVADDDSFSSSHQNA